MKRFVTFSAFFIIYTCSFNFISLFFFSFLDFNEFLDVIIEQQGDSRDVYDEILQGFKMFDYGKKQMVIDNRCRVAPRHHDICNHSNNIHLSRSCLI